MDEIAGINSIADTPGMCSPGLQKSLIALGVVGEGMPGLYDLAPSSSSKSRGDGEEQNPNEISAIDPVDASGVATDLDNSGTDMDNSLLDKVAGSSGDVSVSSPSASSSPETSFRHSPASSTNSSTMRADADEDGGVTDMDVSMSLSASGKDLGLGLGDKENQRRGGRGAINVSTSQAPAVLGTGRHSSKRKIGDLLQPGSTDKIQSKRLSVEMDFSPTTRETRSRRPVR
jgi:hypothetical protein